MAISMSWGDEMQQQQIVLPKTLQTEMMKFFFEAAVRRAKQEQLEARLSEQNDRGESE